tara:strand:+ start:1231 stop:1395 length:165 start_codon:yes stop_codon:yes gene_type:complete
MLWLVHVYDAYIKREKLPKNTCADDVLHCVDLTDDQRDWIESFQSVWDLVAKTK